MTALLLARAGHQVSLFDGAAEAGGRARSTQLGGRPVNLGPHALYRGGPAERTLRSLGVSWRGWRPRPADTVLWHQGQLVPAPVTAGSLLGRHALPWRTRLQFVRRLLTLEPARLPEVSLGAWLDSIDDADVRALLATLTRLASYCNAPEHASARALVQQLASALAGVTYLEGGWQSLVDQLVGQLAGAGVELRLKAAVAAIEDQGRSLRLSSGEVVRVQASALAVGLETAARLVPTLCAHASSAVSSRVATLDLVLDRLPVPSRRLVLGTREPLYWSVHTPPGAAPVVAHAMWTLAPGEHGAPRREALERGLVGLEPGWREAVVASRFLPVLRVIDSIPAVGGDPAPRRVGERLFVTGEWTTRRLLLDAVFESAAAVATEVTQACGAGSIHTPRAA